MATKIKGIDVSYYQGDIDWSKVKSAGIKYAVIREGYRKTVDTKFVQNVKNATSAGLTVMCYHFIYTNNATIKENAQSTVNNLKSAGLDPASTMIFADLEYDTWTKNGETCTKAKCSQYTKEYLEELKALGCKKLGIYANIDYWKNYYTDELKQAYPLWLADYSGDPDYSCIMQQYSSSGSVSGISGNVDMNYLYDESYLTNTTTGSDEVMGVTANDVLDVMRSWLGYSEANGKYKQIIDLYNSHKPLARGYAVKYTDEWCDTTVSAAAIKAGAVDLIGTECGVEKHVDIFKQKGIWQEDGTVTPEPGWIIVYNWDDNTQPNDGYSDHIGYVESVSGNVITAIEGNKGEAVAYRRLEVGNGNIRGYAMPRYAGTGTAHVTTPSTGSGSSSSGAPSKSAQWKGVVTADSLNVRAWAGTENGLCSFSPLSEGTEIDVCDSVTASDGSTWYYICYNGKYGFVHSDYVSRKSGSSGNSSGSGSGTLSKTVQWYGTVTASELNVRTWAGTENGTCSFSPLKNGAEVGVCDSLKANDGDTWYYIVYNGKYGFVHSDYIQKKSGSSSSSGGLSKTVQWTGTVTADALNVRTWAGTENSECSFSPLYNGAKVGVCDSIQANDGSTWYYIKYNNKYGFVHSAYISR